MPDMSPMQKALQCARRGALLGEVPVGAVIIQSGKLVACAHNQTRHSLDVSAHAEIIALRLASRQKGTAYLDDCDLFVTLEPCAMCAQAIANARIRRLYAAVLDPKSGGVEHGARVFSQSTCHHRPEFYSGFCESEAAGLLKHFFQQRR